MKNIKTVAVEVYYLYTEVISNKQKDEIIYLNIKFHNIKK